MHKALFTDCFFSPAEIASLKKEGIEIVKAPGDLEEDELIKSLQDCDIYILGGLEKASAKVINSSIFKLLVFYGTGYEMHVDMAAAKKKGIMVCNTPKANAHTVAEHTVALILEAVKQISYLNHSTKNGKFQARETWNLEGKTLGIIGLGTIGSIVARIMYRAFNMRILYVSRTAKPKLEQELHAVKVDLPKLLSSSDVVSVHASYSDELVNMIGERQLALMQPHSVLVCTTRAALINPHALKIALEKNQIAAAAFDAYYKEPLSGPADDPYGLLSLPDNKFIITPHTAYSSQEAKANYYQCRYKFEIQ